jgi:hypothetical protein
MAAFNVNNYYTTFFRRVQQIFAYFDKIAIFEGTRRSSTQNRAAFSLPDVERRRGMRPCSTAQSFQAGRSKENLKNNAWAYR